MNKILPSILNIDNLNKFLDILDKINEESNKKITEIHVDIMDGIFVENKCGNLEDICILKSRNYLSDVHLMVENPKDNIDKAINFGADSITIHYEIKEFENCFKYLLELKNTQNIKVGISICPETDITCLEPFMEQIDRVLIMSVHPGKGGQTFIEESYTKLEALREKYKSIKIIVDGGVNDNNINNIIEKGADSVVVGSYITKNIEYAERKIKILNSLI